MTKNCIDSLLQSSKSPIVVVDNASPNGSGIFLEKLYLYNARVKVLLNDQNLGFAKGNNVGYRFAKDFYSPSYIVVINNDAVVKSNFEDCISTYMSDMKIDVCGPDIVTLNGIHQNPLLYRRRSSYLYLKIILLSAFRLLLINFKCLHGFIISKYRAGTHKFKQSLNVCQTFNGIILHGSCLVFGKRYLLVEDYAFLPITRFYGEEEILGDYLSFKGYSVGICNNTQVTHYGGQSFEYSNDIDKIKFRLKNELYSYCHLLLHRIIKY